MNAYDDDRPADLATCGACGDPSAGGTREYLTVRYDVTGLTDDERGTLALEALAISEYRPCDNEDGTGGHPGVPVEIDFDVVDDKGWDRG